MARSKSNSGEEKKSAALTGPLAALRDAGGKVFKGTNWIVELCPADLTESHPFVPTGSVVLDYLIGGQANPNGVLPCPGFPRKGITQIWGPEGAGKTTVALTSAAKVCAQGGTVFYLDWENAIVPDYAERLGVPIMDRNRFMLTQPKTLEEGLKLIRMAAMAKVDLIIIDSVGAAVPQSMAERDAAETGEQGRIGAAAQKWGDFLSLVRGDLMRSNSALVGISQTRAKIATGPSHGGPTTEPQGGNAWKYYSDLRIEIRRIKQEKSKQYNALTDTTDDRVSGGVILAKVVKCRLSDSQGREGVFYIRSGQGIDDIRAIIEIAISHGIIKKSGAWFSYGEDGRWQGVEPLRKHFKSNVPAFSALVSEVRPHLSRTSTEGPEADVADEPEEDGSLNDFVRELEQGDKPAKSDDES